MISLICKTCNKEFKVKNYRINTALCCSRKCLWYLTKPKREPNRIKSITGIKSHNNKQIKINCKICKIAIFISPSRIDITKFCSKLCYSKVSSKPQLKYKRIYVDGIRVHEHRHIMELYIGRKLSSSEHVHHINHNHLDNRLENLEVLSASNHAKKHRRTY